MGTYVAEYVGDIGREMIDGMAEFDMCNRAIRGCSLSVSANYVSVGEGVRGNHTRGDWFGGVCAGYGDDYSRVI